MNNKNVGSLESELDAKGLVLLSRPEVECTEWGARSCNLQFRIRNRDYPRLDPCFDAAFGSTVGVKTFPAPPLYPGVADQDDVDLSSLGAQSSRFHRNAGGRPGVGLLEVLYRGACFAQPSTATAVDASARIASTTGRTVGDVVRDDDTGLYWAVNSNASNVAASWHLVPIFTPPWKTSGRTRQSTVIPLYSAGIQVGNAAVTYWSPEYTWRYVVYSDFDGPIIAPFDVGVKQPTIIEISATDMDGAPMANPPLSALRSMRAIQFESVPCGRYFECTETLQILFTGNLPSGVAGGGGETLLAEGTEYIPETTGGDYYFKMVNETATTFTLARVILKPQGASGYIDVARYNAATNDFTLLKYHQSIGAGASTTITSFTPTPSFLVGDSLYLLVNGQPPLVGSGPLRVPPYQYIEWHAWKS